MSATEIAQEILVMNVAELMPIARISDWEKRIQRHDAFWNREIIDRPLVCVSCYAPNPDYPAPPEKSFASCRERWFDTEYLAEKTVSAVMNTSYFGDALPIFNPNLGPEVLSAFFGMEMEFSETTSWGIPNLKSWEDLDSIKFNEDNYYYQKMHEITDTLLEAGKNMFYVGLTDFHPGGDAVAAFRDPVELNYDMIDHIDKVKKLVLDINPVYFRIFDSFYQKLSVANKQATTCWAGIVSSQKWYVPSNDFSCMVSKEMFDEVFLPGIEEECQFYGNSIYHLDGPDALRNLDSLLEIKELNAIQWIFGAGNGRPGDWLDVYKKCQAANKGIQIYLNIDELDVIMENLDPHGVWLGVYGASNQEEAEAVVRKVAKWR